MAVEPVADLIYPFTRRMTGIRRYSEKIIAALERTGTHVNPHRIRKVEFSLRGKPVGGVVSQKFFSIFTRTGCPVVHSLSPDVIMKQTNIATIHDLIPFTQRDMFMKTRRERAGYRLMFGRLGELTLIVQTQVTKSQLRQLGIDESRVEVCGASIQDNFRPSSNPSPYPDDGKKHILTVGDFNPRKRFDVIYRAVNELEGVELYHIGPVNNWVNRYRELRSIADESGKVHMLGTVQDSTLIDYFTHSDLFVYATADEGAGYPPAEALACGTKVLLNPIDVFRELYGDDVFYALPEPDAFAAGIEDALSREVDRNRLLKAASRFSADEEARKVARVYEKVASHAGNRRA